MDEPHEANAAREELPHPAHTTFEGMGSLDAKDCRKTTAAQIVADVLRPPGHRRHATRLTAEFLQPVDLPTRPSPLAPSRRSRPATVGGEEREGSDERQSSGDDGETLKLHPRLAKSGEVDVPFRRRDRQIAVPH